MPPKSPAKLELLPAVDVRDGQAVRLVHGESGTETSYGSPWTPPSPGSAPAPSGCTWSTWTPRSAPGTTVS